MNINILQTDIAWNDPQENQRRAKRLINGAAKADMYVLPEMWNTGFMTNGEPADADSSLRWMQQTAQRLNAIVCGSMAVRRGDEPSMKDADQTIGSGIQLRNRLFFVAPDGIVGHYDKRHLFGYGGEDGMFSPGSGRVVLEHGGWRWCLAVCYDLRFPVWLRNQADYDALLIVANWPESRQRVWSTLLQARAIENQCYVVACNRTGADPTCRYAGGSMIIDPKGRIIAQGGTDEEVVSGTIEQEPLQSFRRKFPVLADRDGFRLT